VKTSKLLTTSTHQLENLITTPDCVHYFSFNSVTIQEYFCQPAHDGTINNSSFNINIITVVALLEGESAVEIFVVFEYDINRACHGNALLLFRFPHIFNFY